MCITGTIVPQGGLYQWELYGSLDSPDDTLMAKLERNPKWAKPHYLRAWREYRGKSLDEVAEAIGATVGGIAKVERGENAYTQAMLEAIAHVLNCEPADLLAGPPQKAPNFLLLWEQIPANRRPMALEVLKPFASPQVAGLIEPEIVDRRRTLELRLRPAPKEKDKGR